MEENYGVEAVKNSMTHPGKSAPPPSLRWRLCTVTANRPFRASTSGATFIFYPDQVIVFKTKSEIDYYILLCKMIGEDVEEYFEEASECEDLEEGDTSEYTPSADSQHGKQRKKTSNASRNTDSPLVRCHKCGRQYRSKENYRKHLRAHVMEGKFSFFLAYLIMFIEALVLE